VLSLRRHIHCHRRLALWLVGLALLMKALVPAGFMPAMSNGAIMVQLCTAMGVRTVAIEDPGAGADGKDQHDQNDQHDQHKAADQLCAFSSLTVPGLAGADPILLAAAIAFILAASVRAGQRPVLRRGIHLRPPSQGPPATA